MEQAEILRFLIGLLALIILPILLSPINIFFLLRIRKVMLKKIKILMSKNVDHDNIEFIDNQDLKEIPAKTNLKFLRFSSNSQIVEASSIRNKKVSLFRRSDHKRLLIEFLFVILYFLVVNKLLEDFSSLSKYIGDLLQSTNREFLKWGTTYNYILMISEFAQYFIFFIKCIGVWLFLKFIESFYQYGADKNWVLYGIKPLWKFVSYLFVSKWKFPLYFMLIISGIGILVSAMIIIPSFPENYELSLEYKNMSINDIEFNLYIYMLIFLVVGIVHFFIIYQLLLKNRNQTNIKLLILRVFGQYELSQNLFTKLGRYWQRFGSFFTVIDGSFYQVAWKKKYNSNIGIYIFISLVLFIIFSTSGMNIEEKIGKSSISNFLAILAFFSLFSPLIVIYYYNARKIKKDVISSEDKLNQRLQKLQKWPKKLDNNFKEVPVLCYNDTWRMAVEKLSKYSDTILMDLRGYSETNKGCEYEVNFLFDHVPINKIVFIADLQSVELIEQLLTKQWKMLLESSPNLTLKETKAIIYVSQDRKETYKETQGILDTLYNSLMIPSPQ